jgi:hypothetical protein
VDLQYNNSDKSPLFRTNCASLDRIYQIISKSNDFELIDVRSVTMHIKRTHEIKNAFLQFKIPSFIIYFMNKSRINGYHVNVIDFFKN